MIYLTHSGSKYINGDWNERLEYIKATSGNDGWHAWMKRNRATLELDKNLRSSGSCTAGIPWHLTHISIVDDDEEERGEEEHGDDVSKPSLKIARTDIEPTGIEPIPPSTPPTRNISSEVAGLRASLALAEDDLETKDAKIKELESTKRGLLACNKALLESKKTLETEMDAKIKKLKEENCKLFVANVDSQKAVDAARAEAALARARK